VASNATEGLFLFGIATPAARPSVTFAPFRFNQPLNGTGLPKLASAYQVERENSSWACK
jgi:hypothetical protein